MDLDGLLLEAESAVVDDAYSCLHHAHVTHYELAGEAFTRQALANLFTLVLDAIRNRDLAEMSTFAEGIARDRFNHATTSPKCRWPSTLLKTRCGDVQSPRQLQAISRRRSVC